jgi:hypothetical protein
LLVDGPRVYIEQQRKELETQSTLGEPRQSLLRALEDSWLCLHARYQWKEYIWRTQLRSHWSVSVAATYFRTVYLTIRLSLIWPVPRPPLSQVL